MTTSILDQRQLSGWRLDVNGYCAVFYRSPTIRLLARPRCPSQFDPFVASLCTPQASITRSITHACFGLFLGFWSILTLLVLSSEPVYAEWLAVGANDEPGMMVYMDPDTIRREGDLVKVWELLDYNTTQSKAGLPHLSVKVQFEYDCANERYQ